MQGPLKASFIVAPQLRERIVKCAMGIHWLWNMRYARFPLYPGKEKLLALSSLPPFSKKQHSS